MQPNRSQQPQQHNYGSYPHPQNNSALAAQAVAAALSNPYGQNYGATQFAQASHYAQAYAQKPVFIQGTSIRLDTPEAIEAWLAERRKRFPTKENVEDKERKMREAVERGQIPFDDGSRRKRKRADDGPGDRSGSQRGGRGGHRGRGRGRGRGRAVDSGWEGRKPAEQDTDPAGMPAPSAVHVSGPTPPTEKKIVNDEAASTGEEGGPDSDSDSDGAPEIITSKAPLGAPQPSEDNAMEVEEVLEEVATETTNSLRPTEAAKQPPEAVKKPRPRQPRRPLYNPFAQRPSLLRNLLLPEIRMTVSNLSQAIHFLVDNDFLDNVELKPGQANERMIEVLPDHAAAVTAPASSVTSSTEVPAVPSPNAS
ncbi:hypothetical protein BN946_scf185007.g277 [Trametes cinnabarina]|uniref:FMR1-interacting protein 1 conserved domain-containing protein n=1 Tax=Pycnoporus cinnabarinus TaxID=5643 RepID=A0A060SFD8_PYCCI|nr:hypothetical protein BN946_scf185007.g277 [Trametes cinnabarina]